MLRNKTKSFNWWRLHRQWGHHQCRGDPSPGKGMQGETGVTYSTGRPMDIVWNPPRLLWVWETHFEQSDSGQVPPSLERGPSMWPAPWPPENMDQNPMETKECISSSEGIRDKPWAGSHRSLQGQPCCSCSCPQKHFRTFVPPDQLTWAPLHIPWCPPRGSPHKGSWQCISAWGLLSQPGELPPSCGDRSPPSPHTINLSAPK